MSRRLVAMMSIVTWVLIALWVAPTWASPEKTAVVVIGTSGTVKPKFVKVIRKKLIGELKSHGLRPVGPKKLKARLPKPKAKKLKKCIDDEGCVGAMREKLGVANLVFVTISKRKKKPFEVQLRVVGVEAMTDVQQTSVKLPKKLVRSVKTLGGSALDVYLEPPSAPAEPAPAKPVAAPAEPAPAKPVVVAVEPAPPVEEVVAEASFVGKPVKQDLDAALSAVVEPPKVPEVKPEQAALGESVDEGDATVHAGSFKIESAADIEKLSGFKAIKGSLTIRASGLVTLSGLESLETITGDLVVDGCSTLTSFRGLKALVTIGRTMVVRGNASLMTMTGLERLKSVGGGIRIQGNGALIDVNALKRLGSVGAELDISNNDSLGTLVGFKSLREVGGYVSVSGNDVLSNLKGLHGLRVIGKDLLVQQNIGLKSLAGLSKLEEVGGHLTIYENEYLQDVGSIGSVKSIRGDVRIDANISLPSCNVDRVRQRLSLAAAGREVVIRGTDMVGKCR